MKKILTIILDGLGMKEDIYGNAVKNAGMTNLIELWNNYPHCLLRASGKGIGLPEDQCSCSELGHEVIGTGREIKNRLSEINKVFRNENLKYNKKYGEMIEYLKEHDKNLHIIILLSDGGVSSHIDHLGLFLKEIKKEKINNNIYIHAITDGKDTGKHKSYQYIKQIDGLLSNQVKLATICGRYYALDETKNYKKTEMYYNLLFNGKGIDAKNIPTTIKKCYERNLSDEYLPPLKTNEYIPIENKDVVFLMNYSKENQEQLVNAIDGKDFIEFDQTTKVKLYSIYEIDSNLNKNYFYKTEAYTKTFLECLSGLEVSQAHIYESIKKYSMEYYIYGERFVKLDNCNKYCINTDSSRNYDYKPEMNSLNIAKAAINCMEEDIDFVLVNFANPDIIGHTGNYQGTINSLQAVDLCIGKMVDFAKENFYKVIITSSHANADTIINRNNEVVPENTNAPVPLIITDEKIELKNGTLTSFAPTILKYMDIAIPKEMKETEILISQKTSSKK